MHSFYEIFPDLGDFVLRGRVLIFERIEGVEGGYFFLKLRVELFGGEGDFFVCIHPYVKG